MPTIPIDRPIFDGEIATYWLDNGVLVSVSKPIKRTVANITANVALVKQITNHERRPLLIYLTRSLVPDKATRTLSTQMLPQIYTAMAMVSEPGLASLIMRLLFRFQAPPIPIRTFTDDQAAKAWLMTLR
jgi:hypothetical protein